MGQAVLHFEKHTKPSSGSLGNHIDRTEGKEYSYRHADLSRTKNNAYLKVNEYCSMDYNEAILQRVSDGYNARNKEGKLKAIRKDAVYSINTILTGSHEDMKEIEKDPVKMDKWIQKNLEFCKFHFGEKNITRFAVHLDEKTPHIHCSFVPITHDGRLSANDIIGTGKKLEEFQTLYAKEMAEFGLERGVKSDRTHHTTEQYRQRERYKLDDNKEIFKALEDLKQTDFLSFKPKKEVLFSMLENLILKVDESTKNEINALKTQIKGLENDKRLLHAKKNEYIVAKKWIDEKTKQTILDDFNLLDYFFSLVNKGELNFWKKSGKEYYFTDKDRKISVDANGKGFYDYKSGMGGQKIKAVMLFDKLDWYGAMNFMNQFSGTDMSHLYANIKEEIKGQRADQININTILKPNNRELLDYFKKRGIENETIQKYAKQIHYQKGNDFYFGIGLKNVASGWDIRSSAGKMKLGSSSYSEVGNGSNLLVFEGMTDFFSMIEILKLTKEKEEDFKFIILNSTVNADKFIEDYQNFEGNIHTILDSGKAGTEATKKILTYFGKNAKDLRLEFNIRESDPNSHEDLNDCLNDITHLHKNMDAKDAIERRMLNEDFERPKINFGKKR